MEGLFKNTALALVVSLGVVSAQAAGNDKTEKEYNEIIELLEEYSNEAYLESHGLKLENTISVYDLEGGLLFSKEESELSSENYRILFQSDLLMESSGNFHYLFDEEDKTEVAVN